MSWTKDIRYFAVAAIAVASLNCKGTKNADLELAAAQAAIDDARKNRAPDCAKEIYAAAELVMREAQELNKNGDHETAKSKAAEAESLANQARGASPPGCDDKGDDEAIAAANTTDTSPNTNPPDYSLEDVLDTVYFDYNQAHIREDSKVVLSKVADVMMKEGGTKLEVEGHCDSRGSTEYNLHLGERRARAVMKYLVTQGVRPEQLVTISYGEERPTDLGDTESAHQKNRRAELKRR